MDDRVRRALHQNTVIDMTTTGRRSGAARRIEIVTHVIGGRIYISGIPSRRTRGWIHHLEADPRLTIHLKRGIIADVPAHARIVTDEAERRVILADVAKNWGRTDLETMVEDSPLIEVTPDEAAVPA